MAFSKLRNRFRQFRSNRRARRQLRRQQRFATRGVRMQKRRRRVKQGLKIFGISVLPLALVLAGLYFFVPAFKMKVDAMIGKK